MEKACANCQAAFEVTDEDLAFYERVAPVFNETRYDFAPPTLCPMCRLQRRLIYRNQIYVYVATSAMSGKQIFSGYPPDAPFPIYNNEEWWGDSWDALDYGRDFDPDRPFFEQLAELSNVVPRLALSLAITENSDFCNNASSLKNCYLVFNTGWGEDCLYCENVWHSKDCIDCTRTPGSELCYDCTQCNECYNLQSSRFCDHCKDSYFLFNCRSCSNCIGCANLRQREYCIFNEQYSKESYEEYLRELPLDSYEGRRELAERAEAFFLEHPVPHFQGHRTEDVTGNTIINAKSVHDSFFIRDAENLRYCLNVEEGVKDCYDFCLFGGKVELCFECVIVGLNSFKVRFCYECWENCSDLLYCMNCFSSDSCFGCIGLRKKQYCIFNKQYTKDEYNELVPRLIERMRQDGEWGEFLPVSFCAQPYNRSYAQRYFPLEKEQALAAGLRWYEKEDAAVADAIPASDLPDRLPEGDETFVVRSEKSGQPFRITQKEIEYYRRFRVPLPRRTYDERMRDRATWLGDIRLYQRSCEKTGKPVLTVYPPDSPYIVWDKDEYEAEFA